MENISLESFLEYLDVVGEVGACARNLELAALASTLDRPITILYEHGQVNAEGSTKDLFLFYQTCGHYENHPNSGPGPLGQKFFQAKTVGAAKTKGVERKGPSLKPLKSR